MPSRTHPCEHAHVYACTTKLIHRHMFIYMQKHICRDPHRHMHIHTSALTVDSYPFSLMAHCFFPILGHIDLASCFTFPLEPIRKVSKCPLGSHYDRHGPLFPTFRGCSGVLVHRLLNWVLRPKTKLGKPHHSQENHNWSEWIAGDLHHSQ